MNIARTLLTLCVIAVSAAGATVPAAAGNYYASVAQYAPHGGLKSLRYGNGLFEGATFNSRQQPEGLTLGASENASDRWRQQYDFLPGGDAAKNNGNVRKLTLTLPGRSPFDTHFTYDALNRLAGVLENPTVPLSGCVAGNPKWCQQFSYDEMGNRAVVQTVDNTSFVFGYGWIPAGLSTIGYPSGHQVVTKWSISGSPVEATGCVTAAKYAPHGALSGLNFANGVTHEWKFDGHLQPICTTVKAPAVLLQITNFFSKYPTSDPCTRGGSDSNGNLALPRYIHSDIIRA